MSDHFEISVAIIYKHTKRRMTEETTHEPTMLLRKVGIHYQSDVFSLTPFNYKRPPLINPEKYLKLLNGN